MKHWKKKPWVDSEVRNWDYIADHLAPDATSADAGKVLTVGESGKPEWGEGGGSGGAIRGFFAYYGAADVTIQPNTIESFTLDALVDETVQAGDMFIVANVNFSQSDCIVAGCSAFYSEGDFAEVIIRLYNTGESAVTIRSERLNAYIIPFSSANV